MSPSSPGLYRKKPVVIEAIQYTGDNIGDIRVWAGDADHRVRPLRGGLARSGGVRPGPLAGRLPGATPEERAVWQRLAAYPAPGRPA